MPNKDLKVRASYQREYMRRRVRRLKAERPDGVCSYYPNCAKLTNGVNKKCDHHLAYMREYKRTKGRAAPKRDGQCSASDCKNEARSGGKLCERCRDRSNAQGRKPHVRLRINAKAQEIQEEVLQQYGGACACCGERRVPFLSIDHVSGYDGKSPRKGSQLYRWLRRNAFPHGFRVLCMTCNFTLGHHGYCPHSSLRQVCRSGRHVERVPPTQELRAARRQYVITRYKLPAFNAYGGPVCVCCGETHIECLQLDHIDQNGSRHRREEPKARNLYIYLRQRGYPTGYRVLCVNCNFAFGHFGACPHQAERAVSFYPDSIPNSRGTGVH